MLEAVGLRVGQHPSLEMPAAARNAEALGRCLAPVQCRNRQAGQDRDGSKPIGEVQDASGMDRRDPGRSRTETAGIPNVERGRPDRRQMTFDVADRLRQWKLEGGNGSECSSNARPSKRTETLLLS